MKLTELYQGAVVNGSRGEVGVTVATGIPTVSKKRNGSCNVKLENSLTQYPIGGYYFETAKFAEVLNVAEGKGMMVLLRVEKQRKKHVDPTIPFDNLKKDENGVSSTSVAKENLVTAVVGVYDFNNSKWVLEGNQSNPDNDPEELSRCINRAINGTETVDVDTFFQTPKQEVRIPNPENFDKQSHLFTFYFMMKQVQKRNELTLTEQQLRACALYLLQLSNEIQKRLKKADYIDYRDYSHNRARYLIFAYEENIEPITQEQLKGFKAWIKGCLAHVEDLIKWSEEI